MRGIQNVVNKAPDPNACAPSLAVDAYIINSWNIRPRPWMRVLFSRNNSPED